jgi:hypothetical protein
MISASGRSRHRSHGRCAEQQRLADAARVENAVGEDVAAVEIGCNLDLIDREALDRHIERHGLDRRHPVARLRRDDALLAGHQRHVLAADAVRDLVVDLAREQP